MQTNHQALIYASILPVPFHQLTNIVGSLEMYCDGLHLDVMDGNFVPNLTFGPSFIRQLRQLTNMYFDAHLMINNPGDFIDQYIDVGCNAISFHIEAELKPIPILQKLRAAKISAGLAINPNTSFAQIKPYLKHIDKILIMTVNPGFSGQKFIKTTVAKIKEISAFINAQNLPIKIAVDGGVNLHSAQFLKGIRIDELISASYLFEGDIATNIAKLKAELSA